MPGDVEYRDWGKWVRKARSRASVRERELKAVYRPREDLILPGPALRFSGGANRRFDDAWLTDDGLSVLGEAKTWLTGDQRPGDDGVGKVNGLAAKVGEGLREWNMSPDHAFKLAVSRKHRASKIEEMEIRTRALPGSPSWAEVWAGSARKPNLVFMCCGLTRKAEDTLPEMIAQHEYLIESATLFVFRPLREDSWCWSSRSLL